MEVIKRSANFQKYQLELPLVWWGGDEIYVIEVLE